MRAGTAIGILAAAGTAALVVLSQRTTPADLTVAATTPFFTTTTTSTTTTTTTLPPTTTTTTSTTIRPTTTTSTKPPTTTTTEDTSPVIPAEVRIQVLNAGAKKGEAQKLADSLSSVGWNALLAADAPENVDATVIMYAEGKKRAALTVAFVTAVPADNVIAETGDANWQAFGDGKADVLVLLGP